MLRSWPKGRHGAVRTPLQLQLQQRQLWGRASDFLSWLGFGGSDSLPAGDRDKPQKVPATATPTDKAPIGRGSAGSRSWSRSRSKNQRGRSRHQHGRGRSQQGRGKGRHHGGTGTDSGLSWGEWMAMVRPQPAKDTGFPVTCNSSVLTQEAAIKTYTSLSTFLRQTPDKTQLLSAWKLVSKCKPFVLDDESNSVRLATTMEICGGGMSGSDAPSLLPMQMVPADVFAQRTSGKFPRMLYVGATSGNPAKIHGYQSGAKAKVVALNEAVVVAYMVEFLARMGAHAEAMGFYRAYTYDYYGWQKQQQERLLFQAVTQSPTTSTATSTTSDESKQQQEKAHKMSFEKLTRLWRPARTGYIVSLAALGGKRGDRMLEFAEQSEGNLKLICPQVSAITLLLRTCASYSKGALAQRAIDVTLEEMPWIAPPMHNFMRAIRANLPRQDCSEEELRAALHVVRRMRKDAGYILRPNMWTELFQKSLELGLMDCALEVFESLPRSNMLQYQFRFPQELHKASKQEASGLLLAMVHRWLAVIDEGGDEADEFQSLGLGGGTSAAAAAGRTSESDVSESASPRIDEVRPLNNVLWFMVKNEHPIPAIKELLEAMETRQARIPPKLLFKVAKVLLDHDVAESSGLPPSKLVNNSLVYWDAHRSLAHAIHPTHLVLHECLARRWYSEGEHVAIKMASRQAIGLQSKAIIQLMEANEKIDRIRRNVRMAKMIVAKYKRHERHPLSERFYEHYLRDLLLLKELDEVRRVYKDLDLASVFPKSKTLPAIVLQTRVL